MPRTSATGKPARTSTAPAPSPPPCHIERSMEFLDLVTAFHSFRRGGRTDRPVPAQPRLQRRRTHDRARERCPLQGDPRLGRDGRRHRQGRHGRRTGPPAGGPVGMPRASRRRGDAARRHADTLRFVLFEARPVGLEFPQLVRASDLTPSQVRSGLAALKDQAAEKGWPPLTWNRATGYQLGAERAVLEVYERAVVREKLTEFRRFLNGTTDSPSGSGRRSRSRLPGVDRSRHLPLSTDSSCEATEHRTARSLSTHGSPAGGLRIAGPRMGTRSTTPIPHADFASQAVTRARCAFGGRMGLYGEATMPAIGSYPPISRPSTPSTRPALRFATSRTTETGMFRRRCTRRRRGGPLR